MTTPRFSPSEYNTNSTSDTLESLLALNNNLLSENKYLRDTVSQLRKDNKKLYQSLHHINQISTVTPPTTIFNRLFRKPWSES